MVRPGVEWGNMRMNPDGCLRCRGHPWLCNTLYMALSPSDFPWNIECPPSPTVNAS